MNGVEEERLTWDCLDLEAGHKVFCAAASNSRNRSRKCCNDENLCNRNLTLDSVLTASAATTDMMMSTFFLETAGKCGCLAGPNRALVICTF